MSLIEWLQPWGSDSVTYEAWTPASLGQGPVKIDCPLRLPISGDLFPHDPLRWDLEGLGVEVREGVNRVGMGSNLIVKSDFLPCLAI